MTGRESYWAGRVAAGGEAAHEAFVGALGGDDVERALRANGVTRYRLEQAGDRLRVAFSTRTPPDAVKFLRFKRLWPDVWEWESADPAPLPGAVARFVWERSGD